jgi:hypothetical protein
MNIENIIKVNFPKRNERKLTTFACYEDSKSKFKQLKKDYKISDPDLFDLCINELLKNRSK